MTSRRPTVKPTHTPLLTVRAPLLLVLVALAVSCATGPQIHWLSIINSFVLVLILTVFLGIILLRVIKNDFTRYMDGDEVCTPRAAEERYHTKMGQIAIYFEVDHSLDNLDPNFCGYEML